MILKVRQSSILCNSCKVFRNLTSKIYSLKVSIIKLSISPMSWLEARKNRKSALHIRQKNILIFSLNIAHSFNLFDIFQWLFTVCIFLAFFQVIALCNFARSIILLWNYFFQSFLFTANDILWQYNLAFLQNWSFK